ncbi:glycosyltransferase family 2 protein [Methanobacterium alcaliphilum]|uniref:glycosyltransferase family 2 protein n=1 Tax=Methanobacterium alcaliphilum TaxID=392018 RepID=UPI00200A5E8D|nr:glycosyltransferase family 2 protein [Methanobacterium alcaliphilum]MCK9150772.1 glycosyltransferase family 2 protein [Methanobacterium alcaliphilum]
MIENNDENSKLISVILPTYNRAGMIKPSIESIINQTYPKWELIICDDGSVDNTERIAQEYVESDSRIIYKKNSVNQGLPRNRNIGIGLSKGELILNIEDDLTLDPSCLETLIKTYKKLKEENKKVGAVAPRTFTRREETKGFLGRVWNYKADKVRENMDVPYVLNKWVGIGYLKWDLELDHIQKIEDAPSWSLIDRKVMEKVGGYEEKAYGGTYFREESDLYFRIRKLGYNLYFESKAIAHHGRAETGGCNVSSFRRYHYYAFRNHIIFLKRNFGWKAIYMLPSFLLYLLYNTLKAIIILKLQKKRG